MKKLLVTIALSLGSTCAFAAPAALLERALQCKLEDKDLASLMRELGATDSTMKKPTAQIGAPAVNVYQLAAPVTAFGYTSLAASMPIQPRRPGSAPTASDCKARSVN